MAAAMTPLKLSHSFPTSVNLSPSTKPTRPTFVLRAEPDDTDGTTADKTSPESEGFEDRLDQLRLKYRSGTGKKAELRKAKKSGPKSSSSSKKGVFLPAVPLKEAVSGGLKVDFGFNPYTERLNGQLAALGLTALLLVELGSGQSLIRYHSPPVLFLQVYTVAAVSAVFVKWEKERISVWPENKNPVPENSEA